MEQDLLIPPPPVGGWITAAGCCQGTDFAAQL